MWNSLRTLGLLSVALLLGTASAFAGDLTNVTLGRSQDFTVVTLFGDGPMKVTHQIVEAKDGKPHRIVVDITGAVHKLPQNNYSELPEGSITTIRTSQFAVSPEPVVRVVLDLAHPATYTMETPDHQVRVLVSLPSDPPLSSVWSARDGMIHPEPFGSTTMLAQTEQAPASTESPAVVPNATEAASPAPAAETPASNSETVQPVLEETSPDSNHPAESAEPEGEIKSLPLAPAGTLAATDGEAAPVESTQTQAPAAETATPSEAQTEPVATETTVPTSTDSEPLTANVETGEPAAVDEFNSVAQGDNADLPQVPMPDEAIDQPERVIDYNLPVPAALAAGEEAAGEEAVAETPQSEPESLPAPKVAVTESENEEAAVEAETSTPTGSDAAVTDQGSDPLASLTTLPPLLESATGLVPERVQVIYHTQGRRDPFKALLTAGGYNAAALPDVASLRLVGVLHDVQESWGLFEDANGYGYILRKGDRVRNGSLTQLTNNRAYFSLSEFGWSRSVHIDLEPEG